MGLEFPDENPTLEQSYAAYSADAARVALDRGPGLAPDFRRNPRTALFHKGVEHHQHKYAAAVWEESLLVHPQWRSRILAPAVTYLNAHESESDFAKRYRLTLKNL